MPKFEPRSSEYQKPRDTKKVLLRLWSYLATYKFMMLAALTLTIVSNLLALVGPMLSGLAMDAIGTETGKVDFDAVFFQCILMIVFYIISSVLSYMLSVLMICFSQKIVFQMRADVFNKLAELPVSFFDRSQAGDIVSRISYDIDTINTSLSGDLIQVATSLITIIGSLLMMLTISPILVLVFTITIPVSILLTKYMTGKVRPLFRRRSGKLGELNGYAEEILSGQKAIKAYRRERFFLGRFSEKNIEAADAYYDADYYGSIVGPCVNFINNLSLAFISVLGAILYLLGQLTPGSLSSFVLYSRKFSGPINEMANILSELQSSCSAAERVFRLIDEPTEPPDKLDALILQDIRGDVVMEDVHFGYRPNVPIINKLNLSVESGNLIAIVGPTGAGKTTLINLLMRFYDPQEGRITIDEHDIRDVTRTSLRMSYAMVVQDTWLFQGTIFDNIAYGKVDASMEEVVAVAKAARIDQYIRNLPDGYQTVLNDDGLNISQGQKQLLTIARAMLMDANMLILDEATSNVDTQTEIAIQTAMRKLMKGKSCFVIAHRLSTIRTADTILVVQHGDIVEQGNHETLMQKNGIYAGLFRSQFL